MGKSVPARKKRLTHKQPKDATPSETICELQLTDYKKIAVNTSTFKGVNRLDIRVMTDANYDLANPNYVYTKAGLNLAEDQWSSFFQLMRDARKKLIG